MTDPILKGEGAEQRPILFKTWPRMYAFVLVVLAAIIAALYFFGRYFS